MDLTENTATSYLGIVIASFVYLSGEKGSCLLARLFDFFPSCLVGIWL